MRTALLLLTMLLVPSTASIRVRAQAYGQPDREQPGDFAIQGYLESEARKVEADFLAGIKTAQEWNQARPEYWAEYFDMLGLAPRPEKTPLHATITRTLEREDYVVEMLHYQSRPGLYVTANVYRPARAEAGQRFPGILYVCGHSGRGRDGVKTAFQSHGIWFARHGYVCMIVDTLQLGEIAGVHHGTYREGRWWWLARGYTPAGVECWNGIRGIDYLSSRPDVDAERIGVTGISGGGAATFWIAAADDRVKAAVPVSGMADLLAYVPNRVVNGHCDCMFLYNAYQWPWTRIAALIAPRPLLFVNSDQDSIFPMDANERVINRLERLYSLFGRGDLVDSFVSIGGHAYRRDIRQAAYRFLNTHLKADPREVLDSEVDLVTGPREEVHPIPPQQLRVFPNDSDIPTDALNARIDQTFVPQARPELPTASTFASWKKDLLSRLRLLTFHHFPDRIPAARPAGPATAGLAHLETEHGIEIRVNTVTSPADPDRIVLFVTSQSAQAALPTWLARVLTPKDLVCLCEPRGIGVSQWTRQNPPNYVERSHYLLGRTPDSGRVWDIAAAARYLRGQQPSQTPLFAAGDAGAAVLAIYAALLESDIDGLILHSPAPTHMDQSAPTLLNVLRVCDIPDALGMVAPRPVNLLGPAAEWEQKVAVLYRAAGAQNRLSIQNSR